MGLVIVSSHDELNHITTHTPQFVIHFYADWYEPSQHVMNVLQELARKHDQLTIAAVDPEALPVVGKQYKVVSVPTTVFIQNNKVIKTISGPHVADIVRSVTSLAALPHPSQKSRYEELTILVKASPCMVFMKGEPTNPKCKFSRALVELLKQNNITYGYFDILGNPSVRQGLKDFSNWPTFPQVYVGGKFIGGLDILISLDEDQSLRSVLCSSSTHTNLQESIETLINRYKVILFMKGDRFNPKCGFSRTMIQLLADAGFSDYETFDILMDQEIRSGLKEFSNWPTFPQLYVNGKFIGGLDICRELYEDGELAELA